MINKLQIFPFATHYIKGFDTDKSSLEGKYKANLTNKKTSKGDKQSKPGMGHIGVWMLAGQVGQMKSTSYLPGCGITRCDFGAQSLSSCNIQITFSSWGGLEPSVKYLLSPT